MNFLIIFLIVLFFLFFIIFFRTIIPVLFSGAFYAPTRQETVKKMISLAGLRPGDKAVDLGSGDGRIVIALSEAGIEAHGYEINPFFVWLARKNIRKAGLIDKASIHWKNFWNEDLSEFDIVTVFGIGYMMKKLEIKLKRELKAGARIVSNYFTFNKWPYSKKEDNIYLYQQ